MMVQTAPKAEGEEGAEKEKEKGEEEKKEYADPQEAAENGEAPSGAPETLHAAQTVTEASDAGDI